MNMLLKIVEVVIDSQININFESFLLTWIKPFPESGNVLITIDQFEENAQCE